MTSVAIDTNVLVYAENINGEAKRDVAVRLVAQLQPETTFLPAQVLVELFSVLVRKAGWDRSAAERAVSSWVTVSRSSTLRQRSRFLR